MVSDISTYLSFLLMALLNMKYLQHLLLSLLLVVGKMTIHCPCVCSLHLCPLYSKAMFLQMQEIQE